MKMIDRIDPELAPILDFVKSVGLDIDFSDLAAMREKLHSFQDSVSAATPPVSGVSTADHLVPYADGSHSVRVRVYQPTGRTGVLPVLFWIHGGGYVLGRLQDDDLLAGSLAVNYNCVVASVDYRLAPEHPFPTPLEDCYTALKWLYDNADTLGVNRARIAIGGQSAGGGLAAALGQLARDRKEVPLCYQLLIYPMLDDRNITQVSDPAEDNAVWSRVSNLFGWRSYLGQEPGTEATPLYAAPGRTEDLRGLPPTYLYTGDIDLFAAEDIDYARRLLLAGVPTELHVYPGAYHAFEVFGAASAVGQRAIAERDAMMKKVLHG